MKMESFLIGPIDEELNVHVNLSLKQIKFIHGTLVDCYEEQSYGEASSELANAISTLEKMIKHTLLEKDQKA